MVPFHRPCLGPEEEAACARVLRSGWLTQGPEVEAFEHEAAVMLNAWPGQECIAVSNCTAALYLLLKVHGVDPTWRVVVPNLTFAATANAALAVGAELVIADTDEDGLLDVGRICLDLPAKSTAIIPVSYAGQVMPWPNEYLQYCLFIYDQAHSFHPGAYRHNSAWSFFPTKNITTGEGGLIGVPSYKAAHARELRNHGRSGTWNPVHPGALNFRMTDLQAAIGREQLKKLPMMLAAKRRQAAFYDEHLADLVGVPRQRTTHLYPIRHPSRDRIRATLAAKGIATSIHYRVLSDMETFRPGVRKGMDLSVSERIGRETLSLPFYFGLTEAEQEQVVKAIKEAL